VLLVKETHLTFEASVSGGQVTLNKVMETPLEYKGNHDLVVDARDRRYFVRVTGVDGWSLPERIKGEAVLVAKSQIEISEPLRN
jgi:hypothetical protein